MALVDHRLLMGGGNELAQGLLQGQGIRQNWQQSQDQGRTRAAAQAFQQAAQGKDITKPEGMGAAIKAMSDAGFADEARRVFEAHKDMFPAPKPTEYDFREDATGLLATPKNDPTKAVRVPGYVPKPEKPTGPTAWEIAKEEWERKYKKDQLAIQAGNTAKDNDLAAAKWEVEKAKKEAEMARKAVDVGEVEAQADEAVSLIDQMIGSEDGKTKMHPGFKPAVGAKGFSSFFGLKDKPVAGTDAAGFAALYDQVKGGAFLEAVQKMKGSGALSDTEGKAAANAITRMQMSTSEGEFIKAAQDFRKAIKNRKGRVVAKAVSGTPGMTAPAANNNDPLGIR